MDTTFGAWSTEYLVTGTEQRDNPFKHVTIASNDAPVPLRYSDLRNSITPAR
jgi:hypothetical protein